MRAEPLSAETQEPVVVVDYDDQWPQWFEAIAAPVREAVADLGARVEHVGSTAVRGLVAKPVIDVDVVVREAAHVRVATERLGALGYVHEGEKGIAGREAFLWPKGTRRHHLYVVVEGSRPYLDHVDLRDYLREHPDVAAAYGALKRDLAARHGKDRVAYTDAKDAFVSDVLRAARR